MLPAILTVGLMCCADLPPGFQRSVAASGLVRSTVIDFLPDGTMLVAGLFGQVIACDQNGQHTVLQLTNIATHEESGLLGMAVDPDFNTTPYIYLYYTSAADEARIGRFTVVNGQADLSSEVVIWQNPQLATGPSHHGGNICFGPDGRLYIACGEEVESVWAQDLTSQRGKILRINKDGTVPLDNPFADTPGDDPHIWAYGFRNPFRTTFDPLNGDFYVGDVGFDTWEEVDRVSAGDNGGWPNMEGIACYTSDCSGYNQPIWVYQHCDPTYAPECQAAIILGPVYRAGQFPAAYDGNLFVADLLEGWVRRVTFDGNGDFAGDEPFLADDTLWTIVDMKIGPDGALYYTNVYLGEEGEQKVYRVEYRNVNDYAPVAVATANPTVGNAPLAVQFDATNSTDQDSPPGSLTYSWTFGDGDVSDEPDPLHIYTVPGRYHALVTVSDGQLNDTAEVVVTVGSPPTAEIVEPTEGTLYRAGDTIHCVGAATDPEDGVLGAWAMSWTVTIIHESHTHPFIPPQSGLQQFDFAIPTGGHPPENLHYRIEFSATDSSGAKTTVTRDIQPVVSTLSLHSDPEGVPMFLNGNPIVTPRDYQSVVGFNHFLEAPSSVLIGGTLYQFVSWDSGSPQLDLAFAAPEGGLTMTAFYTPQCLADFNNDGFVTGDDFDQFTAAFDAGDPAADVNGDGFVTGDDFDDFTRAFDAGC